MRARYPDTEGFVERDGVKVAYEVFGSGEPALVFAPTDPLVHSRAWKAQVPYLARTSRVVTIDPRGNRLDRHGAGRCLDYDQTGPEALARAIGAEIGRLVSYRPVVRRIRPRCRGPRRRPGPAASR